MSKGLIPARPEKRNMDEFIGGAAATKADSPAAVTQQQTEEIIKMAKFMLEIAPDLRTQLKIEAIQKGFPNMSAYICAILERREELVSGL